MPTYRLTVEYDGADFAGFQVQPALRTVGGELEAALARIFAERVRVTVAGRTDAGVHATAQVVSFRTVRAIPVERLPLAMTASTPDDLGVRAAHLVADGFNARFAARERTYEYLIVNRPVASPLVRRYAHHVWRAIDPERFRAAAAPLIGEHDFATFRGELPESGGTVREVRRISLDELGDGLLRVTVAGNAFLHRMVRIIVGTLVDCATGYREVAFAAEALAARDRRAAGYTAPAAGLYLAGVRYDDYDAYAPAPLAAAARTPR